MKSLVRGAALRFAPYIFDKDHFHPDDLCCAGEMVKTSLGRDEIRLKFPDGIIIPHKISINSDGWM